MIAHLNINLLSPKFEQLSYLIKDKIDILLISETKLDASFPKVISKSKAIKILIGLTAIVMVEG